MSTLIADLACLEVAPHPHRFSRRLACVLFSAAFALLICELGLRLGFAESNGAGVTIASQRWLDRHWTPVNSLGYRDAEPNPAAAQGKRVLWVVGDSYAAGWGIENVESRFGDLLSAKLGPNWIVHTIAKPGWDTRRQLEAAATFPIRPDVVVHAYCLNDADRAAADAGLNIPTVRREPNGAILASLVQRSHLANLLWWRWQSIGSSQDSIAYWNYIQNCYESDSTWNAHANDLSSLMGLYSDRASRVIAFVIPNLLDVRSSQPMAAKVNALLESRGASVVDLTTPLLTRQPADLVVNRFDPHANESVHALIADLLFERISATLSD